MSVWLLITQGMQAAGISDLGLAFGVGIILGQFLTHFMTLRMVKSFGVFAPRTERAGDAAVRAADLEERRQWSALQLQILQEMKRISPTVTTKEVA